jgi:general secretion pathway protein J
VNASRGLGQRGFTLLELLVVMTLLSVIMLGLVSALHTMAQTESRIDARLTRLDEIRVSRSFLQQTLGRVSAMTVDAPGAIGKKVTSFAATPDSLTWVGIMPARPDVGGRHHFRLGLEDNATGRELVLRFALWNPDLVLPDWSKADSRVLIAGIQQMRVQAQGLPPQSRSLAEPWPKDWQNGWPIADILPEQVRLSLSDANGDWPDWTLALHALPQGDGSYNFVVIGGGK